MKDTIYVVDFGGQYAHLIANRIRRLGVYTEIKSHLEPIENFKSAKGIILSGGPQSVNTDTSPHIDTKIFELHIPVLGICYGHQYIGYTYGAEIGSIPEYGKCNIDIHSQKGIFTQFPQQTSMWQNHGDALISLPDGFEILASTSENKISAIKKLDAEIYSVQFHPEVTHSKLGMKLYENFVFEICKCSKNWSIEDFNNNIQSYIQEKVREKKVLLLVSGGVDSTVCFSLLNTALGKDRVFGVHIDTGFMRKDESQEVSNQLKMQGFDNLEIFDASDTFFHRLENIYDPEEKRKIIGDTYLDVKDQVLSQYNLNEDEWIIAQGTIYPDTIESGGTHLADTIKTHHNRVDKALALIEKGLIIEPLRDLYKDEVRDLGVLLGLPDSLIQRHPFPGPGLAIRALCIQEEKQTQAFPNLPNSYILGMKSVGIKGDARSYASPLVIEGEYNYDALHTLMRDITRNSKEINRVLYNIGKQSLRNTSTTKQYLERNYIILLQEVDALLNQYFIKNDLHSTFWQCPIVIIPLGNEKQKYSIILRPIDSIDAMSADSVQLTHTTLHEISRLIEIEFPEIYTVLYDLTSKPPATIEWE